MTSRVVHASEAGVQYGNAHTGDVHNGVSFPCRRAYCFVSQVLEECGELVLVRVHCNVLSPFPIQNMGVDLSLLYCCPFFLTANPRRLYRNPSLGRWWSTLALLATGSSGCHCISSCAKLCQSSPFPRLIDHSDCEVHSTVGSAWYAS